MPQTLKQLNLILDTITDGVMVVDPQGVVIYANQAAEQLLERGSLIGHSLAIPISADKIQFQDINLIRPSGIAWAELRSTPLEWEGAPAYVIGLRDITARKQAEIALQESELLFHTLSKIAPVGIFRTNEKGECDYVNHRWCEITGLHFIDSHGGGWIAGLLAEDRESVIAEWQRCVSALQPFNMQYRFLLADGSVRWVVGRAEPELDEAGGLCGYVGTITDISDIKANEERLGQAAAVFESTREGVMITDAHRRITMVNKAFSNITGYDNRDVIGHSPSILSSGRHNADFYREMWAHIATTDHWQGEIWNRRKCGEVYPELLSISTVRDGKGEISHYVGVFADISKLKASEMELEFLAHHDPLTKLPNRMLFLSRLQHNIEKARRQANKMAVLMLDLDRFKDVNDSFGHLAGDDLLQMVAERLTSRLRTSDTICRLGGDEFVVLLEEVNQPETVAHVATQIINALNQTWRLPSGHEVRIGVSVGIAMFPEHGASPDELIQQADTALYQAKNEGRNRFKYFSEDLTRAARERIDIEIRLRQAIEQGELRVFFQPQICIENGAIIGAEALVRWQTASGELIPPLRFIPIAEETGLITSIGNWVLRETCLHGQRWRKAGFPPLRLAVNLSPQQFLHSDISDVVAKVLAETGFPADCLELELTESALMKREKEAIEILHKLHGLGVHLAIDDFGTGYSSLAYLKLFPLDVLKIDKSFIEDIPQHTDDMEITATIIAMAKTLRMRVVAEGVETAAQLAFLKSRQCDLYQGYLVSKPLPIAEFEKFLTDYALSKNIEPVVSA
ncbi:sensor domain-containing protein [Methylomonas fluvii]|uniref:EAL domain-containing protein n=1 Tax=Methylomonas fluvii TaxID=1854564 RepID=A0ABR9DK68_9GAMM|nr:EAL domain-containing protein [Methylomonas fluvii]MBD9363467.1 EAL domain-containing protein [Methylomonas fluvii]CAD6876755.1 diguanylate cyclase/phosphodiesterase (GGDEF & EAL domains) with PAS/PAC sensor(s) [Methylomonas fluvii]